MGLFIEGVDLIPIIKSTLIELIEEEETKDLNDISAFILNEASDYQLLRVIMGKEYSQDMLESKFIDYLNGYLEYVNEQTIYGMGKSLKNKAYDYSTKNPKATAKIKWGIKIGAAATFSTMIYKMFAKKYIDACKKLRGDTLTKCIIKTKIKAYQNTIQAIGNRMNKCNKHINPDACRTDHKIAIRKIKNKIKLLQKRL